MNKIVLTGATGKLGQNIVKDLHKKYDLIVLARDIEKAKRLLPYNNIDFYLADLNKLDSVIEIGKFISSKYDSIYGIINNAGVDINSAMLDTYYDDFFSLIRINELAPYIICKELIPTLINNKRGRIINISSNLASYTVFGAVEYSMSKAALESLSRSIAVEFGNNNICCNTVVIGGMRGYMTKVNRLSYDMSCKDVDYTDCKVALSKIPLKRQGIFQEYVDVISFLLSDKASYINGAKIHVDGGISIML